MKITMASELGVYAQVLRVIFIILNGIFVVLGVIDVAIGIWLIVEADSYDDASSITGENITAGGVTLLVSGVITIALCTTAIVGAVFKLRPLLIIYAVILSLIVLLQVISAIFGFVNAGELSDEVEDNCLDAVRDYRVDAAPDFDDTANDAVDYLQEELECAGCGNYTDYIRFNREFYCTNLGPPESARCDPVEDDDCIMVTDRLCSDPPYNLTMALEYGVWEDGCYEILEDVFEAYSIVLGVLGLFFAILETVGVVLAILLCVFIHKGISAQKIV